MISENIKKYQEIFDAKPNLTDVSDIILTRFISKDEKMFCNMMTGKKGNNLNDVIRYENRNIYLTSGGQNAFITGFYVDYNEERDVLVVYTGEFLIALSREEMQSDTAITREWRDVKPSLVYERDGSVYGKNIEGLKNIKFRYYMDMCSECHLFGNKNRIEYNNYHVYWGTEDSEYCESTLFQNRTNRLLRMFYGNSVPKDDYRSNNMFQTMGDAATPFSWIFYSNSLAEIYNNKITDEKSDRFLKYELPNVDNNRFLKYQIPQYFENDGTASDKKTTRSRLTEDVNVGIVQHVTDGISVIRVFSTCVKTEKMVDTAPTVDDIITYECFRIYITDDMPICYQRFYDKWVNREYDVTDIINSLILDQWTYEDSVGTGLEYIWEKAGCMLNSAYVEDRELIKVFVSFSYEKMYDVTRAIFSLLKNPLYKSIFSSPLENVKDAILLDTVNSRAGIAINNVIGSCGEAIQWDYDEEKQKHIPKNIMDFYDLPLHMIKTFNKVLGEYPDYEWDESFVYNKIKHYEKVDATYAFATIRGFFQDDASKRYFRNMNDKQFETLLRVYLSYVGSNARTLRNMTDAMNCIAKMNVIYGVKNVQNHMSYVLSYVRNLGQSTRDKYYDYIKMTCAIKNLVGKPRWKFQDENDIKTAHDEMMFIYNMHKDDEREKEWQRKFNAVKPNLDALSYKEEEFSIIAPEKPSDIANEGLALNHCVKSYIDAVVDGRTNIMFVRKTNDLKKPFYTLEVQNNQIRQCHGFCNSNVDAVCGLESFLRRYCKTIGITYQKGDRALAVG